MWKWKKKDPPPSGPSYEEKLSQMVCPVCGSDGLLPSGGFGYICPTCGHDGIVEGFDD